MSEGRPVPPASVPTLTEVLVPARAATAPPNDPVEDPPAPPAPGPVRDPGDAVPEREPGTPAPERDPPAVPEGEPPPPPMRASTPAPARAPEMPTSRPLDRVDGEQLTERLLGDLQRHIDLAFEYRIREALAPVLARVADGLVRDARGELTGALRELVSRSVAEELRRQRTR